jgi:hypothetical protein
MFVSVNIEEGSGGSSSNAYGVSGRWGAADCDAH